MTGSRQTKKANCYSLQMLKQQEMGLNCRCRRQDSVLDRGKITYQRSTMYKDYYRRRDSIFLSHYYKTVQLLCEILLGLSCVNFATDYLVGPPNHYSRYIMPANFTSYRNISQTLNKIDPTTKLNKGEKRQTVCLEELGKRTSALTLSGVGSRETQVATASSH